MLDLSVMVFVLLLVMFLMACHHWELLCLKQDKESAKKFIHIN